MLRQTHTHTTQTQKLKVNIAHVGVAELVFISLLTIMYVCTGLDCVLMCVAHSIILVKNSGEFYIGVLLIPSWAQFFFIRETVGEMPALSHQSPINPHQQSVSPTPRPCISALAWI